MSDRNYLLERTTKLEERFRKELHVSKKARGLGEQFDEVKSVFEDPEETKKYVKLITDIRNDMVHKPKCTEIDDVREFDKAVKHVDRDINRALELRDSPPRSREVLFVLMLLVSLLLATVGILANAQP